MQLRSPEMRSRLIDHLRDLSDLDYQKKHWKVFDEKSGTYDEFDNVVHFLYDETDLAQDPDSLIGWALHSKEEASSIRNLVGSLEAVFDVNGMNLDDQEYITTKEWSSVLRAASEAISVFQKSG